MLHEPAVRALCPYVVDDDRLQCGHPAVPLDSGGADATRSLLWVLAIFVNVGMWLERYVIVVTACTATSCRRRGACTTGRSGTTRRIYGTLGLFLALMFLFIRFLPVISIAEMRELVHETQEDQERHGETTVAPAGAAP